MPLGLHACIPTSTHVRADIMRKMSVRANMAWTERVETYVYTLWQYMFTSFSIAYIVLHTLHAEVAVELAFKSSTYPGSPI